MSSPSMFNAPYGSAARWQSSGHFPDPFCDMASLAMPQTIREANYWTEFILLSNGPYREAISRVISYFLTQVEIISSSQNRLGREEKQKYDDFLQKIGIIKVLRDIALDYTCFQGDTRVPTRDGVYAIRDLVGKTVDIISEGGIYRPATFKSFGRQKLLAVTFSDGRKVYATAEHQWVVQKSTGGTTRVPTTKLAGRSIPRTVAPRPPKNADFDEGVRHGFTFGDGSLYNKNAPRKKTMAVANFFGDKDAALLPCFAGVGGEPRLQRDYGRYKTPLRKIHGLPSHYKELPPPTATASYWYGFVCGFLAADGSVDTYGCAILTQKSRDTLAAIEAQLPRIGMAAGPIRSQHNTTSLPEYRGRRSQYARTVHMMTLLKQFMCLDDFLIAKHRDNFERNWANTNYGKYIGVQAVEATDREEEVYCCVEPETHSFTIDNGILTGNCYGNSFISVIIPFTRFLMCGNPDCRLELPLKHVYNNREFNFQWANFEFRARCPHCNYRGAWRHIDRRVPDKITIKRWNPHEIDIVHETVSNEASYIWRIADQYRTQIRRGTLFHLERAPWEVIEAVRDNMSLQFDASEVFHLKESTFAGVRDNGWGLSRVLTNFRQAWYFQILQRFNEAIALDHIVPFRCVTPMPRPGSGGGADGSDPVLTINLGDWRSQVERMIRDHQQDPARWNILNYPIQYQSLGGDATQLAPKDLIEQGLATLLNAAGIPVELYNASLTTQAAPTALRLFEANWSHLTYNLNEVLNFVVEKISMIMNWEPVRARLKRVTHADDLNRQMAQLQLMMGGQLSRTTGLATVGANFEEEERRKIEEEQISAELTGDAQKEMEQSAMMQGLVQGNDPSGGAMPGMPAGGGGQPPQGGAAPGMPAPPGPMGQPQGPQGPAQAFAANQPLMPHKPQTVEEWEQMAETIVGMLLTRPDSERQSLLVRLKKEDRTMHALVKSRLDEVNQQAATQGKEMVLQQQYGKQAQAAAQESAWRRYRRYRPLDLDF